MAMEMMMMRQIGSGNSNSSGSDLHDAKLEEHRISASRHCPSCGCKLDWKPVSYGIYSSSLYACEYLIRLVSLIILVEEFN